MHLNKIIPVWRASLVFSVNFFRSDSGAMTHKHQEPHRTVVKGKSVIALKLMSRTDFTASENDTSGDAKSLWTILPSTIGMRENQFRAEDRTRTDEL